MDFYGGLARVNSGGQTSPPTILSTYSDCIFEVMERQTMWSILFVWNVLGFRKSKYLNNALKKLQLLPCVFSFFKSFVQEDSCKRMSS